MLIDIALNRDALTVVELFYFYRGPNLPNVCKLVERSDMGVINQEIRE